MTLCYCWLGQVPDSRKPNSTRESGTKDYYGLRLVPDCREPNSTRESGTNVLVITVKKSMYQGEQ